LSVESNVLFALVLLSSLSDWLKRLAPLFQPIKSKTKTTRNLLARVFPRLTLITCICFDSDCFILLFVPVVIG